jgi:hypothetical protein
MGQHYREFRANADLALSQGQHNIWDGVGSRMTFHLQFLKNLLQRSTANDARIQNEIALVRENLRPHALLQLTAIGLPQGGPER